MCSELEELEIPDRVIGNGDGAFTSCFGLMQVNLPANFINIEEASFDIYENLT